MREREREREKNEDKKKELNFVELLVVIFELSDFIHHFFAHEERRL
jgi:hypothetical protein